jgi:hypothetical protein
MMKFPFYRGGIKSIVPNGTTTLADMIEDIRNPSVANLRLYESIVKADRDNLLDLKRSLKEKVKFCNPAVITDLNGRGYKNITGFTGYMVLDFDKFEDADYANDFKRDLHTDYDCILAVWRSVSGRGVHAIVSIPVVETVDEYKRYFHGFGEQFKNNPHWDKAPQNPVLPSFLSYDRNILYRSEIEAIPWLQQSQIEPTVEVLAEPLHKQRGEGISLYETWSLSNAAEAIGKIEDNGHPQLRAAAFTLGGRIGGGYVDYFVAEQYIHQLIASNSYLSKGTIGYQKTASVMLIKGMEFPLYF